MLEIKYDMVGKLVEVINERMDREECSIEERNAAIDKITAFGTEMEKSFTNVIPKYLDMLLTRLFSEDKSKEEMFNDMLKTVEEVIREEP